MRRNRKRDTRPEIALRSALHARGARFRVDFLVQLDGFAVRPDVVFTRRKLAVFVDGCFWHGCPDHGNVPQRNAEYWRPKLERNSRRDRAVDEALLAAGWTVLRAWEHEPVNHVADKVVDALSVGVRRTLKST